MANKRMFHNETIFSTKFLRLPGSAQALYLFLGMNADDEGVVNAFTTMGTVRKSEDDLRLLEKQGFVAVLNDDLVAYILDWPKSNPVRKGREKQGIYHDLLMEYLDKAEG